MAEQDKFISKLTTKDLLRIARTTEPLGAVIKVIDNQEVFDNLPIKGIGRDKYLANLEKKSRK